MRNVQRHRDCHGPAGDLIMSDTIECGGTLSVARYTYHNGSSAPARQRVSILDDGYNMINLTLNDALEVASAIVQLCGNDPALADRRRQIAAEIETADTAT